MRSSKQRSRNKQNRQNRPTGGNIINRVFDSSGPEGKVRGTPAQIIEKYAQLHRDAQLAGDRVNAENFAQHAEHYTRMLAEAQRDVDRAREEQEQFNRDRQAERDRQFEAQREANRERDRDRERTQRFRAQEEAQSPLGSPLAPDAPFLSQPLFPVLVAEPEDDMAADAGLVETPEERARSSAGQATPNPAGRGEGGGDGRGDGGGFGRRDRPRRADDRRGEGRGDRDGPREDRGLDPGPRARPWREASADEPAKAARPEPARAAADPTPFEVPAESQATPGEDGARPGLATTAEEPAREVRPRRPRRPRQPRAEAAETAAPDAAE